MRSMFWRIFLGFWLTMILGGAASVMVMSTFRHLSIEWLRDDMSRRMDENLTNLIITSGQAALQMYTYGGRAEYDTFIRGIREGAGIELELIGGDNKTITGKMLPAQGEMVVLADRARHERRTLLEKTATGLSVAKVLTARGEEAAPVVVGFHTFGPPPAMRPPGGKGPPVFARILPPFLGPGEIVRTAVMLLIVSGVCYFLARSLVTPIRRLRKITQQIAGGDYSARVGGSLGRPGNEIADLGRDFDIMVERTETVINSQNRLLRDISHELRSPLARLNVALALAKKRLHAEDDLALAKIGQEADRLNELIGQLLVLSRLESGAELMPMESVDLTALLRTVVADADFEAALLGRQVAILASDHANVAGSRELLRRAVENIVRNAARYTAPGTRVEVSLSREGDRALVVVRDYGPGVPAADLPHLFQPFYRVAKARERGTGGTGIGLAIAMQAVKAHGGTVCVQNTDQPTGLMVTITLPLAA